MFKHRKKEEVKIRYFSMRDILKSLRISRECGMREVCFDWKEIAVRNIGSRNKIIRICKRYGKVKRHLRGFSIKLV